VPDVASDQPTEIAAEDVEEALTRDPARRILSVCIDEAKPVREISEETGLAQATAYRHVNQLVEDGLLVDARSAMTPEGSRYELYRSRIEEAALEVDREGVTVTWTPLREVEERIRDMWDHMRL
jgi:DNA-binding IclR family transcriptional regulator